MNFSASIIPKEDGTPSLVTTGEELENLKQALKPFSGKRGFAVFYFHEDPTEQHLGFYHAVVVPWWQSVRHELGDMITEKRAEYECRAYCPSIWIAVSKDGKIGDPKELDDLSKKELNLVIENIKQKGAEIGFAFSHFK